MASYREQQNAGSLEDRQNIVVSRLNQLNDAVTKAKTTLVQKESLYNQVKALAPGPPVDSIPAILQNQYIQSLKTQVADLERDRANLSERYGDRHPEIIKINASIKDASRQLELELAKAIDAIRNDYQASLAEEAGARRVARRTEERGDDAGPQERQLHRARTGSAKQPSGVREPARPREGAAGAGQQPRQQRPAGRGGRDPGLRRSPPNLRRSSMLSLAGRPGAGRGLVFA